MRAPSGPRLTGYVTRFAQVVEAGSGHPNAGSSDRKSSLTTRRAPSAGGDCGGDGAMATQTRPPAVASALGVPPRGIVFVTFPERGSRRMTVPSRLFATQRALGEATTAAGPSPTRVLPATAFVSVSTRTSSLSPAFATQAPAGLTATAAGPLPT